MTYFAELVAVSTRQIRAMWSPVEAIVIREVLATAHRGAGTLPNRKPFHDAPFRSAKRRFTGGMTRAQETTIADLAVEDRTSSANNVIPLATFTGAEDWVSFTCRRRSDVAWAEYIRFDIDGSDEVTTGRWGKAALGGRQRVELT